jgi:hypothetical protein
LDQKKGHFWVIFGPLFWGVLKYQVLGPFFGSFLVLGHRVWHGKTGFVRRSKKDPKSDHFSDFMPQSACFLHKSTFSDFSWLFTSSFLVKKWLFRLWPFLEVCDFWGSFLGVKKDLFFIYFLNFKKGLFLDVLRSKNGYFEQKLKKSDRKWGFLMQISTF